MLIVIIISKKVNLFTLIKHISYNHLLVREALLSFNYLQLDYINL